MFCVIVHLFLEYYTSLQLRPLWNWSFRENIFVLNIFISKIELFYMLTFTILKVTLRLTEAIVEYLTFLALHLCHNQFNTLYI